MLRGRVNMLGRKKGYKIINCWWLERKKYSWKKCPLAMFGYKRNAIKTLKKSNISVQKEVTIKAL